MVKRTFLAVTLIHLTSAFAIYEDPKTPRVEQLVQEIQNEASKGTAPRIYQLLLSQLQSAVSRKDQDQIEQTLATFIPFLPPGPKRAKCERLHQIYQGRSLAQRRAMANSYTAAFERAKKAIAVAKSAGDLDKTVAELAELENNPELAKVSFEKYRFREETRNRLRFVEGWRKFLSEKAAGNHTQADTALRDLANSEGPSLIARSRILDQLQKLDDSTEREKRSEMLRQIKPPLKFDHSTRSITFDLKSPEDLKEIINAYQALKRASHSSLLIEEINASLEALASLDASYQKVQSGVVAEPRLLPRRSNVGAVVTQARLRPIQEEITLLALPRFLDLPPDNKTKEGETIDAFLQRIRAEAIARQEYRLAARVQETERLLQEGRSRNRSPDPQTNLLMAAKKQEAAGELALAVTSYQRALASGGELVPATFIGERLSKIKQSAPDEYRKGIEAYLSPDKTKNARK